MPSDQSKPKTVEEAERANAEHLADRGPALSYGYTAFVIARDPENHRILLSGLGSMGMGTMWMSEPPDDDHYKPYPGYAEAKIVECPESER